MNCILEWFKNRNKHEIFFTLIAIIILIIVLTIKKENIEFPQPSPTVKCPDCDLDKCGSDGDSYCNKSCTKFKLSSGKEMCVLK